EAIIKALDSPLLNDNKITGAKNVLLLIVSGSQEITIDEIGEINDHIQIEAGHGANIIMGVGEDESLGEAIAVTVIATGFNVDQQDTIVNTDPKKIVHKLEEERKVEQELVSKPVVHRLVEEEEELGMDLVPTSNYIRSFNVFYEEVVEEMAPDEVAEDDFIIIDSRDTLNDIEVVDPEVVPSQKVNEDQFTMSFDMPFAPDNEEEENQNVITFNLDEEVKDVDVNDHIEVIPVLEYNKKGETRYSLDDYMELENKLTGARSKAEDYDPKIIGDELVFEKKTVAPTGDNTVAPGGPKGVDPMETPIEELLRERSDERRRKLKDFNYRFQNSIAHNDDELNKQPAYKRQGVDLAQNTDRQPDVSRFSVSKDTNGDIQLRSNNSFLNDNVD
ncbi:MAG: cell division protein FtsZ, partial [Bacteroidota bacterium]